MSKLCRINLLIGIDTGVQTGVAVWCVDTNSFVKITTVDIIRAVHYVLEYSHSLKYNVIKVRFEDSRKIKLKKSHPEYYKRLLSSQKLRRDCQIWEDFLKSNAIAYEAVNPQNANTKVDQKHFKQLTGLNIASENSRDAAMLVYEYKN